MVPIPSLWLPILLSAVLVFLASWILHMLLTYHRSDYGQLPDEDAIAEAMNKAGVQPGNYYIPWGDGPQAMSSPEWIAKCKRGPVALINVQPSGPPNMGKTLAVWFVFALVVSVFVAYVTGRTQAPGAAYLSVFRVAGTAAFLVWALGEPMSSIWKGQSWSNTFKSMFDGLIYALLTAGAFGWLWP